MTTRRHSVVVCSYAMERFSLLESAIESLRAQSVQADEIIVVIDHNPLLLARVAKRFGDITVVASSGPPGLSGARNTGTALATGDVVVFVDDDAVAEQSLLATLTSHYDRPEILGVDARIDPVWETAKPRWWPDEFNWVIGCSYRGLPTSVGSVRNLIGCAMSLRRDVVLAAGGFDSGLGRTASGAAGCEETDLCLRMAALSPGGLFLHEPATRVRHHVPAGRATVRYFWTRCHAEGASKRLVSRRAGSGPGLASERAYVRSTLPAGFLRNVREGLRGDVDGLGRAAMIATGLVTTAWGYLTTRLGPGRDETGQERHRMELDDVEPVMPLVIDVMQRPADLDDRPWQQHRPDPGSDSPYTHAACLILSGGVPLGTVHVRLGGDEITTSDILDALDLPVGKRGELPHADRTGRRVREDTTVAIATRGRPETLAGCLASIAAGTVVPGRIVVVDNARPDRRTEELVARYRAQDWSIQYVREDRPGLARAHNAALRHVATDLVAFTDDDVWVHECWLEAVTDAFDADPVTVCVTGMIAPRELDTLPQQWVETRGLYNKGYNTRVFDAAGHVAGDPLFPYAAGAFGSGANMSFRTRYLEAVGGFDVALGTGTVALGGDDLAAFYDVIRHGERLTYEPSAIVLHPHHRDYSALRRQVYGYGAGLGAHLTRCVLTDPRAAVTMARHARAATARLRDILATEVLCADGQPELPEYPRDLARAQRRGLASGPARYLLSRYREQRVADVAGYPAAGRASDQLSAAA